VRRAGTALLLLLLGSPAAASTPGGGSTTTDCLTEFGGTPANRPPNRPRDIRCTDNDPACDEDPAVGACRVRVEVCLNVTDPALPGCGPAALTDYFVENEQPDTNPRHDFDFQTLEDRLTFLTLPVDPTDRNVCSGDVFMNVPLGIRFLAGGARYSNRRKTIRTTVSGPGGVVDVDRMRVGCARARHTTPCDGVTSTFDQIQKHVFTATCARSTCHNVAQGAHDMSLSSGEAYASLVGVPAVNPVAAAAGSLRVAPGNATGSFIVQKLRAQLAPGEGARMPLDLPPYPELAIELIEQWIAAGAPATGFVAAVGCH
jgi:hypothetical protein